MKKAKILVIAAVMVIMSAMALTSCDFELKINTTTDTKYSSATTVLPGEINAPETTGSNTSGTTEATTLPTDTKSLVTTSDIPNNPDDGWTKRY